MKKNRKGGKSLRDMIYFPIVYNVVGLFAVGILYAVSAEHVVEPEVLNTVLYLGVVITHWSLFYAMARRLGIGGIKQIIIPRKKMRWSPSIIVFATLNALFTSYMILALVHGRIPSWGNLNAFHIFFYIVINPITAGFVEEFIWRGYSCTDGYSHSSRRNSFCVITL